MDGKDTLLVEAEGNGNGLPVIVSPKTNVGNVSDDLVVQHPALQETATDNDDDSDIEEITRQIVAGPTGGFGQYLAGVVQAFGFPGKQLSTNPTQERKQIIDSDTEGIDAMVEIFGVSKKRLSTKKSKWSSLHIAASNGSLLIVKTLLAHKADVDPLEDDDWTPLHLASQNGHYEVVKELLAHGADKDARAADVRSPLFQAAGNGKTSIVTLLLDCDANPNITTDSNKTALFPAAGEESSAEIIKILVDRGADVNHASEHDMTPLHIACTFGYLDNVKALLEAGASPTVKEYELWTPLHFTVHIQRGPCTKIVEALLEKGVDINAKTNTGRTPLHLAAGHSDSVEVVELLIRMGANIEARDNNERTPIFQAVSKGSLDVLNIFINAGADWDVLDGDEMNLLHIACARGDFDIVEKLVSLEVDVNAVTPMNWMTPLMVAVAEGNVEIVNLLLENKANPNRL